MDERRKATPEELHAELHGEGQTGASLVWEAARTLTSVLESGRDTMTVVVETASTQAGRLLGSVRDATEDIASYLDPSVWLEDIYALIGVASAGSIGEIDERVDEVELRVQDVARQRAREELMLLQQRIAELESVLSGASEGAAQAAMGTLMGRLSELEARIDALPFTSADGEPTLHP